MKFLRIALILAGAPCLIEPAQPITRLMQLLEQQALRLEHKPGMQNSARTQALILAAAQRHNVHPALVKSIVAAESNFDNGAISPRGAIGLMQLMPATAQQYGADPTDPEQNIDAGTRYLRALIERYGKYRNWLSRVIAAYNAGPGVVDRYQGVPPFPETRNYVARVLGFLRQFEREPA